MGYKVQHRFFYWSTIVFNAAKEMLIDEPKASVLSIGLSVGFSSQSNFYTAFSDIVGMPLGGCLRTRIETKMPEIL